MQISCSELSVSPGIKSSCAKRKNDYSGLAIVWTKPKIVWNNLFVCEKPLSVLKVNKSWLPWLLIFMRFHETFNVTNGCCGVDFSITILPFQSKELGLMHLILSITDVSHINWPPSQIPGIWNQALVFWEMWKFSCYGLVICQKVSFLTPLLPKNGSVWESVHLRTFWWDYFLIILKSYHGNESPYP